MSGEYPLLLPVMGEVVVLTSQLLPLLCSLLDFDHTYVSCHGDKLAGGAFDWKRVSDPEQIKNRHAVVSDDILDKGHTMVATREKLREMGATGCRAVVFANRLIGEERSTKADYVGLDMSNRYAFGCGMDAVGCWHNLDEIYVLNQS